MDLPSPSAAAALVLVARLSLGLFLLPSAFGKLTDQRSFVQGVLDYHILPERAARGFALMLPWIELLLALALILGVALPLVGSATVVLLLCFIAAVLINLRRGREIACNCYGIAGTKTISWGTVARNVLLMVLAAIVIGLAPNAVSLAHWIDLWHADRAAFSSITSALLVLFLIGFCFVTIQLVEWTVDISTRLARFKARS